MKVLDVISIEAAGEGVTESLGYKYTLIRAQRGDVKIAFGFSDEREKGTDWYNVVQTTYRKFEAPEGKRIQYIFYKNEDPTVTTALEIVVSNINIDIPEQGFAETLGLDVLKVRTTSDGGSLYRTYSHTKFALFVHVTEVDGENPTLDIKVQGLHSDNWADLYKPNSQNEPEYQIKLPTITQAGLYCLQFEAYCTGLRVYWTINGTNPSFKFVTRMDTKGKTMGGELAMYAKG